MNERRDKNTMERWGRRRWGRYSEHGRAIEQLRGEERRGQPGAGRGRDMVWQIKEERGAAANCSPDDASLGLQAADSGC